MPPKTEMTTPEAEKIATDLANEAASAVVQEVETASTLAKQMRVPTFREATRPTDAENWTDKVEQISAVSNWSERQTALAALLAMEGEAGGRAPFDMVNFEFHFSRSLQSTGFTS